MPSLVGQINDHAAWLRDDSAVTPLPAAILPLDRVFKISFNSRYAVNRALAGPQVRHRDMVVELTDHDGYSSKSSVPR